MALTSVLNQDMIQKVDDSITYLNDCVDYTSKDAHEHFTQLSSYTNSFGSDDDNAIAIRKYLGDLDVLGKLFTRMWGQLSPFLEETKIGSQGFEILQGMLVLIGNISDSSPEIGVSLGKHGAISLLFDALESIKSKAKEYKQKITCVTIYIFGLLHNTIRLCPANVPVYRHRDAVSILKGYLGAELGKIWQVFSLLILAYITADSEKLQLVSADVGVRVLLILLKEAAGCSEHRGDIGIWYFSAFEILDAINQLAINDEVKKAIRDQDAIPYIIQMLGNDFSLEEQKVAAEAIWNLAFIESIRQSDIVQATIPTLTTLSKSNNKDLSGACTSALFQIQGEVSPTSTTPPTTPHQGVEENNRQTVQVMISYQWDSQQRAIAIRDRLVDAGCKVWMDETNMKGDILESMSDAVQTSTVVLTCLTERYKNSKSCRSEATYAYKLDKKIIPLLFQEGYTPDGWLGLLQGMDLYYSFHSDHDIDDNMTKLLQVIMEIAGVDEADAPIQQSKQQALGSARPSAADWSTEDVQQWLITNDLRELCEAFQRCGGKHLFEMYSRCRKNEEKIYDQLKSDYNLKLADSTVFVVALKEAFQE